MWEQVGPYLSLLVQGQGAECWRRAAVDVSGRYSLFYLPPWFSYACCPCELMASDVDWSFSQKYGVLFPLAMSWNLQLFQYKCSGGKKKRKVKSYKSFLSAGVANWCTFMFLPPAKKKSKSPSMWFWQKRRKCVRMEGKSEKSSLCCLQAVQMQVWGTPSQSVDSYSPGWKVGGKEQGSRTERERV